CAFWRTPAKRRGNRAKKPSALEGAVESRFPSGFSFAATRLRPLTLPVPRFINTTTFATRDFCPRRGASDADTLPGSVRREQRRLGQKAWLPGWLRRFSVLASLLLGHSPTSGMLPRRASPEPKIDATNVVVFVKRGT